MFSGRSQPLLFSMRTAKQESENENAAVGSEKSIHLIWLGSPLRDIHVQRVIDWEKLNPDYRISYWVEPQFESDIKKQLAHTAITVKSVSSLTVSKNLENFIQRLVEPRKDKLAPNYAAASDIYRFIILMMLGWYVDADVFAFDVSQKKINNHLHFLINGKRADNNSISVLAPSVIAAQENNLLIQTALECLEEMSVQINEEHIELIRSDQATTRMMATHNSTGFALRAALGKMFIEEKSIIETLNEFDNTTRNEKVFDSISSEFENTLEQSWILNSIHKTSTNQMNFVPIPGVILDKAYLDFYQRNIPFDGSVLTPILSILRLRLNAFVKVQNRNVLVAEEQLSKAKVSTSNHLLVIARLRSV